MEYQQEIEFKWAMSKEEMLILLTEGWKVVAEHPCYVGRSILMRRDVGT